MSISVKDRISAALIELIRSHPFIAIMGIKYPLVEDKSQPTMYVDGRKIGYNPNFINTLNKPELIGVVAHEIMHLALLHLFRISNRNRLLWNYATDLAINWILREDGFSLPSGALYSSEFANMPAEEIYDRIEQELRKRNIPLNGRNGGQNQQGSGNAGGGGSGSNGQNRRQDGQGQSGSQQGQRPGNDQDKQEQGQGQGGPKDRTEQEIVDILEKVFGATGTILIGNHDMWNDGMLPGEMEKLEQEVFKAIQEAHMLAQQKTVGKEPGLIDRLIGELLRPKIHWTKYVKKFIQPREEDLDYTSPNKFYSFRDDISPVMGDVVLPGPVKMGEKLEGIVFVLDTSGSISKDEATRFVSEMQGLMRQYPETAALYMSCDADCTEPVDLHTVDGSTIDVGSIRLKGGGGTSFKPPFEFFERPENRRKYGVRLLIYFTDGYGDFPEHRPYFPTIFAVTTDKGFEHVPAWAQKIRLDV